LEHVAKNAPKNWLHKVLSANQAREQIQVFMLEHLARPKLSVPRRRDRLGLDLGKRSLADSRLEIATQSNIKNCDIALMS
jgi:hypothetical protein